MRLIHLLFLQITDCFAVPHMEKADEVYVAINKDYHKSMYGFHRRINRKEVIVGWYTTVPEGSLLTDNSSLIHEFYSHECRDPIHLVVDASLTGDGINIRAFIGEAVFVGDNALANMFQEISVELAMTDAEVFEGRL
jgi:translation initiation factor 3 subunit F